MHHQTVPSNQTLCHSSAIWMWNRVAGGIVGRNRERILQKAIIIVETKLRIRSPARTPVSGRAHVLVTNALNRKTRRVSWLLSTTTTALPTSSLSARSRVSCLLWTTGDGLPCSHTVTRMGTSGRTYQCHPQSRRAHMDTAACLSLDLLCAPLIPCLLEQTQGSH